jgi:hypothetical protein
MRSIYTFMGPSQDTDTIAVQPVSKPQISRGERLFLLGLIAAVLLLSTLPYIAGYYAQTSDRVFIGAVFDKMDYAVHLATMQLGARGEWKYQFQFTSEAHQGAYVKLFYIFLGHVSAWTGLSVESTYQVSRWVFGALALLVIYYWIAQTFSSRWVRGFAFLLAAFGSGLGWLQLVTGLLPKADISPIDFWLIDAYIFFGLLVFPHFSAVTAILAGMLSGFISIVVDPAVRKWVAVAMLGVLAQFIQPFAPFIADLAVFGGIIWIGLRVRRIPWRLLAGLAVISCAQIPLLVYNTRIFFFDPIWREFSSQNVTLSPPPVYYLCGFGLLWPAAVCGGWKVVQANCIGRESDESWLPHPKQTSLLVALVWSVAAIALAFSPYNLQRRFMHAFVLPLSLLAAYGLFEVIFPWLDRKGYTWLTERKSSLSILLVSFAGISSIYLSLGTALVVLQRPDNLFESKALIAAIDWLQANANQNEVVLAAEPTSQVVAARTGLTVCLGHPIETLAYEEKRQQVNAFFSNEGELKALSGDVRWIIYGPHERELGQGVGWSPPLQAREAYHLEEVSIYQLLP